jgi:dextranase
MRIPLLILLTACSLQVPVFAQGLQIIDAYPDKARYSPGEPIVLDVETSGTADGTEKLEGALYDLGREVGHCDTLSVRSSESGHISLTCSAPAVDYRGYLVTVRLESEDHHLLRQCETAIDVSSDWRRFPRYGYLAHYNRAEGADPVQWIAELNRFHIDGLQFYDFQYRHDQPLAGTPEQPAATWKDIAGREIDRGILEDFIQEAHNHNIMAMAYNASYSAYQDAFTRDSHPLPLTWGTWSTANGVRTAETAKSLSLQGANWSTSKLLYMNPNNLDWQRYIFGQMKALFSVYAFDGWHVDTFGEKGAFAFDRSPVDFIGGFRSYIDHAHTAIGKPIVFNAVNTWGQDQIAQSSAEFVYSELWEDHETFGSILATAEQVHVVNPNMGFVIAAYVHRREAKDGPAPTTTQFNTPSVLLTDAAIFASGAAHIELGDGNRMLSSEYFPADTRLTVSPKLYDALRHYYDFLTAYEVYLRDDLTPASIDVKVDGVPTDALAVPNTLWSVARKRDGLTVIHLINLMGSDDPHWRDISMTRPDAPHLHDLRVKLRTADEVGTLGWASPDVGGGIFHPLKFERERIDGETVLTFTLPELHYWDTIFLSMD